MLKSEGSTRFHGMMIGVYYDQDMCDEALDLVKQVTSDGKFSPTPPSSTLKVVHMLCKQGRIDGEAVAIIN